MWHSSTLPLRQVGSLFWLLITSASIALCFVIARFSSTSTTAFLKPGNQHLGANSTGLKQSIQLLGKKSNDSLDQCNQAWPDLELMVPINVRPTRVDEIEFEEQLVRSLNFFWPKEQLKMVLVLDKEVKDQTAAIAHLVKATGSFASSSVDFNSPSLYYYCK